jgi:hypothetical protein
MKTAFVSTPEDLREVLASCSQEELAQAIATSPMQTHADLDEILNLLAQQVYGLPSRATIYETVAGEDAEDAPPAPAEPREDRREGGNRP